MLRLPCALIKGATVPVPMVLLSSISTSGGMYPAAFWCGVTIAIFLPIDLMFSYSSSSITVLFSDGDMPGPISGAPKS